MTHYNSFIKGIYVPFCRRKNWLFIVFLLIFLIFTYKDVIFSKGVGSFDWYYKMIQFHSIKETILKFSQFPHWVYGYYTFMQFTGWGYTFSTFELFAQPETSVISPTIFFNLLFDLHTASNLTFLYYLIIGVIGFYFLGRYFLINNLGIFLININFFLGYRIAMHYTQGHPTWMTLVYAPWVLLFFLKSLETPKYLIFAIIIYSLTLLEGGQHVFIWIAIFLCIYSLVKGIETKNYKIYTNLMIFFTLSLLLSSIKLIPSIHFFSNYKPPIAIPPYNLNRLIFMLFDRRGGGDLGEHGNYIGVGLFIIFLISFLYGFLKHRSLACVALFFLLLSINISHNYNLIDILRKFPFMASQRFIPRFMIMAFLSLSFLSALLISEVQKFSQNLRKNKQFIIKILLFICIGYITYDLYTLCKEFQKRFYGWRYESPPLSDYSKPLVVPTGKISLKFYSPNIRIYKIKTNEEALIIFKDLDLKLYKNILKWEVRKGKKWEKISPLMNSEFITLKIPKGITELKMIYNSLYFNVGLTISVITIIGIILIYKMLSTKKTCYSRE